MQQISTPANQNKRQKYESLLLQIKALVSDETDLIANLSNVTAALKEGCGYFWVGFYFVKGEELVLGPFQGPVACTRIGWGKGVCGKCWEEGRLMVVPDVEKFPGHIACSSASKSEIVLPVVQNGRITMVLDVDSEKLDDFDELDQWLLQGVVGIFN